MIEAIINNPKTQKKRNKNWSILSWNIQDKMTKTQLGHNAKIRKVQKTSYRKTRGTIEETQDDTEIWWRITSQLIKEEFQRKNKDKKLEKKGETGLCYERKNFFGDLLKLSKTLTKRKGNE